MIRFSALTLLLLSVRLSLISQGVDPASIAARLSAPGYTLTDVLVTFEADPVDPLRYGSLDYRNGSTAEWVIFKEPVQELIMQSHELSGQADDGSTQVILRLNKWSYRSSFGDGYPRIFLDHHLEVFQQADSVFRPLALKCGTVEVPGSHLKPGGMMVMTEDLIVEVLSWIDDILKENEPWAHHPLGEQMYGSRDSLPPPYSFYQMVNSPDLAQARNMMFTSFEDMVKLAPADSHEPTLRLGRNSGRIRFDNISTDHLAMYKAALVDGELFMTMPARYRYVSINGFKNKEAHVFIPTDGDMSSTYIAVGLIGGLVAGLAVAAMDAADGGMMDKFLRLEVDSLSGHLYYDPSKEDTRNASLDRAVAEEKELGLYLHFSRYSKSDEIQVSLGERGCLLSENDCLFIPYREMTEGRNTVEIIDPLLDHAIVYVCNPLSAESDYQLVHAKKKGLSIKEFEVFYLSEWKGAERRLD